MVVFFVLLVPCAAVAVVFVCVVVCRQAGRLDEAELLELKRAYEAQIAKKFPVAPQLRQQAETKREDEAVFLV